MLSCPPWKEAISATIINLDNPTDVQVLTLKAWVHHRAHQDDKERDSINWLSTTQSRQFPKFMWVLAPLHKHKIVLNGSRSRALINGATVAVQICYTKNLAQLKGQRPSLYNRCRGWPILNIHKLRPDMRIKSTREDYLKRTIRGDW